MIRKTESELSREELMGLIAAWTTESSRSNSIRRPCLDERKAKLANLSVGLLIHFG
jgi:hypothetical protein